MAVNSSSNDSLHPSFLPCLFTKPSSLIFIASSTAVVLLLVPLFVLVLYLGFQRRQQQRSSAVTSHSDSFAYHMASIELLGVLGFILSCSGIYRRQVSTYSAGVFLLSLTWFGQTFFHILTCVERYLAVVHPVTYLSLRTERGIRIRNISIGAVWLLGFASQTLEALVNSRMLGVSLLILSLVVTSFCSLSVLCTLIRPGPGEQGRVREGVDQSKRRAFYTIVAILGVLLMRCAASVFFHSLDEEGDGYACRLIAVTSWLNVPSSLVLPLLFLHRAGTLARCKNTTQ
ncbi:uncharacterized protein ACO6RY_03107 [Pungitius sinensis]